MLGGQLGHADQGVEGQRRAEVVDGAQRGVEGLYALGVVDLVGDADVPAADVDGLAAAQLGGLAQQVAEQVVGGGDADRQVRTVGQLTEDRGFANGRVEAQAVHADVFGVFATGVDLVGHVHRCRAIDQAEHLAGGRVATGGCGDQVVVRGEAAEAGQLIDVQARIALVEVGIDGRFLRVVVHEVETELGGVELFGDVAERHAELPVVLGVDVLADAGDLEHAIGVQEAGALQAAHVGRRQLRVEGLEQRVGQGVDRGVGGIAAVGEQVGLGVVGAHRVDGRFLPVPLVEGFHRQVLGQAEVEAQGLHRNQHFLQLGAGQAELGGIHRVGGVHAATVEDALAPVEHLLADTAGDRHIGHVPVAIEVGVEDLRIAACLVAGLVGEAVILREVLARLGRVVVVQVVVALVHDLGVIESGATDKHAVVLVGRFQVGSDLVDLGNQAGIEVAVTVVGVDVVVGLVPPLHAPELAVGNGGVDGTGNFIVGEAELHRLGLGGYEERQDTGEGETCLGRCETQQGRAGLELHRVLLRGLITFYWRPVERGRYAATGRPVFLVRQENPSAERPPDAMHRNRAKSAAALQPWCQVAQRRQKSTTWQAPENCQTSD
ncbi:hypothetical protein D3C80_686990 [compost metagenome]